MPKVKNPRISFMMLVALAAQALLALPAFAQEIHHFDVQAANVPGAVHTLGEQSGVQIFASADTLAGKHLNSVAGDMTTDAAFQKLLAGTGLSAKYVGDRAVALVSNNLTSPATAHTSRSGGSSIGVGAPASADGVLVAQAQETPPTKASSKDQQNVPTPKKLVERSDQLEEVVVTGSRIPLSAGQQSVQPVRTYTREDISNSAQSTVGEFLNTLPDVSTLTNATFQLGFAGIQTVQLHGLPVGTTLTLLDGRRVETSSIGVFDLGNIPVSAVERVEILPVGASAIYGADALGGAVNIILRKNLNGLEVNAALDHAPGVNDPSVNLAWGKTWERGAVSVVASYEDHGELMGSGREPTSLTQFPGASTSLPTALFSDSCAPGNVYSLDGSNLPGLSSPYAGIPSGITGLPTIGQFSATAGKLNGCSGARYQDITPKSQREGALILGHFEFSKSADLFTEILLSHRHLRNQRGPQLSLYQSDIPASNAYNPFGQDVLVSFSYPGSGQPEVQSSYLVRPLIGVRGAVFSDWHYDVTAALSRDRLDDVQSTLDSTLFFAALGSSDPATALNPFATGAPGSPQLLSSLGVPTGHRTTYESQSTSAQAILRGPIGRLPAGVVQSVFGGEWSREKQALRSAFLSGSALRRNSVAIFGEARVPLLSRTDHLLKSERLILSIAGRYDHSEDYGGKPTGQAGLLWYVTSALSFNGSYGQSYRAPRLNEISGPQTSFFFPLFVTDPFRGGELVTYPVTQTFGPNVALRPESGISKSLGATYVDHGLRTSVTWYDLSIKNYIGPQDSQVVVNNPNLFPGVVTRAPPTLQDQQLGQLGPITQIAITNFNFGDLRIKGIDADVSYAFDTPAGQITPSVAIANIYQWQSALAPGQPGIDAVSKGTLFGVGWAPRWRGTVALAWKSGPIAANIAGRYIGRYLDYQDYVPNAHKVGNTWIVDASARYEVGDALSGTHHWLSHAYAAIGVVNLLNRAPPFSFTSAWYDYNEYDVRGRYIRLSLGIRM